MSRRFVTYETSKTEVNGGSVRVNKDGSLMGPIQSDMQETNKNSPAFIKNQIARKTLDQTSTSNEIANPEVGITEFTRLNTTKSINLNNWTYDNTFTTHAGHYFELQLYLCRYGEVFGGASNYIIDVYRNHSKLDSKNAEVAVTFLKTEDPLKLYFIFDLSALSDENKLKFPNVGVYIDVPEIKQADKWAVKNITLYGYTESKMSHLLLPNECFTRGDKELILSSSTEGSSKQFKITVDDTGALTATEV